MKITNNSRVTYDTWRRSSEQRHQFDQIIRFHDNDMLLVANADVQRRVNVANIFGPAYL